MRLRAFCIETFKAVNNLNPAFISKMFSRNNNEINLPDCSKMTKPKVRTQLCGMNTFRNQGSKLWNELPPDMKEAPSIAHFKSVITQWNGPASCCGACTLYKLSSFKLNWPKLYWKKCNPFQSKWFLELCFIITWKRFITFFIEIHIL